MYDARVVQVLQRIECLDDDLFDEVVFQRVVMVDVFKDSPVIDVLHHDIYGLTFFHPVDELHDVWVRYGGVNRHFFSDDIEVFVVYLSQVDLLSLGVTFFTAYVFEESLFSVALNTSENPPFPSCLPMFRSAVELNLLLKVAGHLKFFFRLEIESVVGLPFDLVGEVPFSWPSTPWGFPC